MLWTVHCLLDPTTALLDWLGNNECSWICLLIHVWLCSCCCALEPRKCSPSAAPCHCVSTDWPAISCSITCAATPATPPGPLTDYGHASRSCLGTYAKSNLKISADLNPLSAIQKASTLHTDLLGLLGIGELSGFFIVYMDSFPE